MPSMASAAVHMRYARGNEKAAAIIAEIELWEWEIEASDAASSDGLKEIKAEEAPMSGEEAARYVQHNRK